MDLSNLMSLESFLERVEQDNVQPTIRSRVMEMRINKGAVEKNREGYVGRL